MRRNGRKNGWVGQFLALSLGQRGAPRAGEEASTLAGRLSLRVVGNLESRAEIMRCLCVLVCVLVCSGCMADGDKGSWDEFWKDLRGDNMKMRSDFSGMK
jgi:hypothetical protein